MIDIHTHIMYGVDDGATSEWESLQILEEAERAGFTDVILTPHYMEEYPNKNIQERQDKWNKIQGLMKNIDLNLYLGNEVFLSLKINEGIKEGEISTLNNSKYILVELPMTSKLVFLEDIILQLRRMELIPIIAHPERYTYVQENPYFIEPLIQKGALFQANYGSLINQYGKEVNKTIQKLLKKGYIHFLATDCHSEGSIYSQMDKIMKELKKYIDEDNIYKLTEGNPRKILLNQ